MRGEFGPEADMRFLLLRRGLYQPRLDDDDDDDDERMVGRRVVDI